MAKTQNTISKKQENKGARGILGLTSTLGQTLKQFDGIYSRLLPECDGLTVEGWMSAHGVERYVTPKGAKKGYTPALLMDGWHEGMKVDKQAFVFKNVVAKCFLGDDEVRFRVFTKEEAEKVDGKPISRYMLQEVPANNWSVLTILKGLKQGNNFQKEEEKMLLSEIEWEKIENVYVVMYEERIDAAGRKETVRKVVEVNKAQVTF